MIKINMATAINYKLADGNSHDSYTRVV